MRCISIVLGVACVALVPKETQAQSSIDPTAAVVELRTSCALPGGATLDNCFETSADVTNWLWNGGRTSEPNSLDLVTVRVGPGTFDPFDCNAPPSGMRGFVSVQGSGRDVTRFVENTEDFQSLGACTGGVTALGCTQLSFLNLTAEGLGTGVLWTGPGSSQWENVDMIVDNHDLDTCAGEGLAWYDALSTGSLHYFWNVRFEAFGLTSLTHAFLSDQGESWIYGSELLIRQDDSARSGGAVVNTGSTKGIRIFGSAVRAHLDAPASTFTGFLTGLKGGVIHMHGGIINVDTSASQSGIAVSILGSGALVHTPETAFALKGPTLARILGPIGTIQSPYLWPSGTTPPSIFSETGADLFVKTNEGPGQNEPRLFVYDSGCSPDRWRNMTTGNCL